MRSPVSLTARLSLLFAGSAACVLLIAGLLFERAASNRFLEHDMEELDGKMALIHETLGNITSFDALAALPLRLHDTMMGHPGIAVTVASGDGKVLFSIGQSAVVDHLLRNIDFDQPGPQTWSSDDHSYRIVAKRVALGMPGNQAANVAIAFDITRDQVFMREFQQFLWFGMILAALAMGWLAWVAVRKGLSPLNDVSAQMASITAQQLDMPIPAAAVPQELVELVTSFNTMLARLDDSFRRLSEFSSDIAHELRTPIQNLVIQTEVTLTSERGVSEYRANLQSNLEEFARLSRMISDMLFLAKADNMLLVPHREWIDLHSEVARMLEFYEALASDRGVRLTQSGAAVVHADRLMLQRALSNLLSNAIRFTPDGQAVEITLGEVAHRPTMTVANPGTAIPAKHLSRIFDRLYRVDASRQDARSESLGLGLAITKSIIEMHGGSISVESGNEWTCFTITFPAVPVPGQADGTSTLSPQVPGMPQRVADGLRP